MGIPLTLISGYLGTGKTTLINNLLRTTKKKIALLVNDFGDVNIDESLIEARTDSVLSIAGGCVCCSYGNELIETLESMNSNEILPDHIVLEASGIALPSKIIQTISLMEFLSFYGTVLLTDASHSSAASRISSANGASRGESTRQMSSEKVLRTTRPGCRGARSFGKLTASRGSPRAIWPTREVARTQEATSSFWVWCPTNGCAAGAPGKFLGGKLLARGRSLHYPKSTRATATTGRRRGIYIRMARTRRLLPSFRCWTTWTRATSWTMRRFKRTGRPTPRGSFMPRSRRRVRKFVFCVL